MIKLVENLRPEDYDPFETLSKRIIIPYPNTYTYTKALSEVVVRKYGGRFNTAVIRPSIVSTTFHDPIPGYTDNVYGVNGVVVGAGVGILRILHINNKLKANIIPADFVVNAMVGLAWFTVLEKYNQKRKNSFAMKSIDVYFRFSNSNFVKLPSASDKDFHHDYEDEKIKIYHCTVSNDNPVT